MPTDQREASIHNRWGFQCQCALCAAHRADPPARDASDTRRVELARIPYQLAAAAREQRLDVALTLATAAREIYVREGARQPGTVRGVDGKPVADPFGPPRFSETLGHMLLANGHVNAALPQLRAALLEKSWRSAGWASPREEVDMAELRLIIRELEAHLDAPEAASATDEALKSNAPTRTAIPQ